MQPIFSRGIYLPLLDLWLDSTRRRDGAVVSHAHSDHVGRHSQPILSRATLRLLKPLLGHRQPRCLEYGEPLESPRYTLTLYPSGHMLGSAQVLIQCKDTGERILYTGDFKLGHNPVAEPAQIVPCDTLIMETTFGRPCYSFPPPEEVVSKLASRLRIWLERGEVPVVLGYRLGKAQELLHHLLAQGLDVAVEASTWEATRAYEELGVTFPGRYRPFDGVVHDGEVLLFPPSLRGSPALEGIRRKRTVMVSGWAMDRGTVWRLGVDEALPLSDHADYQDLIRYVKAASPKVVYTVNGFPDLAAHLRKMGYQAFHLDHRNGASAQLPLF